MQDKLKISNGYLLPDIMKNYGFENENIKFEEDVQNL